MSFRRIFSFFLASVVLSLLPLSASADWYYSYTNCGRGGCSQPQQSPAYPTQAACDAARNVFVAGRSNTSCTGNNIPGSGPVAGEENSGAVGGNYQTREIAYSPLVNLPFVGSGVQTIGGYLTTILRLLIGLAGIAAVVQMILCGFKAIMSLNPSARGEAGQCVIGALTGLLLALSAWVILYQINPTLLSNDFNPAETGAANLPPGATPQQCDDPQLLCQGDAGPSCSSANSACAQYSGFATEFAGGGIPANLIREVMAQESGCNISAGSSVGACGLMQLLPTTASQHKGECGIPSGTPVTCAWLKNPANARLSICLAAAELRSLRNGNCSGGIHDVIAGYNGGPGACKPTQSCPPAMQSCSGGTMRRWECPYDGNNQTACNTGFRETRTYVRRFIRCGL